MYIDPTCEAFVDRGIFKSVGYCSAILACDQRQSRPLIWPPWKMMTMILQYVFSDLIVLWRAWVLWDRDISPRVMGFFVFIWAGTMGNELLSSQISPRNSLAHTIIVTAIACAETTNTDSFVSGTGLSAFEDGKTGTNRTYSQWFVWGMSLSANVMGTGLIGFKAWYVTPIYPHVSRQS